MRIFIQTFFLLLFFLVSVNQLIAQTCSCAGAPLLGAQSIGTTAKGNLVLGLTYEYNDISDLYSGSSELNNRTQERNTMTTLLEANYGITDKLSVTATLTYIRKHRVTGLQNPEFSETTTTSGIGDGLFMAKYSLHESSIFEPYEIALGGGVKVPFGTTSLTRDGLQMNADMQPGSGAWDTVGWLFLSKSFLSKNITVFLANTFRKTGENERFSSSDKYKFGNELVSSLGINGPWKDKISYLFMVRYRSTGSDERNGSKLPSTGGKWLKLKSGLSYQLNEQLGVQLSGQLPVYQYLNGTQPTTSFILSGSLFFNFNKNDSGFINGTPKNN